MESKRGGFAARVDIFYGIFPKEKHAAIFHVIHVPPTYPHQNYPHRKRLRDNGNN